MTAQTEVKAKPFRIRHDILAIYNKLIKRYNEAASGASGPVLASFSDHYDFPDELSIELVSRWAIDHTRHLVDEEEVELDFSKFQPVQSGDDRWIELGADDDGQDRFGFLYQLREACASQTGKRAGIKDFLSFCLRIAAAHLEERIKRFTILVSINFDNILSILDLCNVDTYEAHRGGSGRVIVECPSCKGNKFSVNMAKQAVGCWGTCEYRFGMNLWEFMVRDFKGTKERHQFVNKLYQQFVLDGETHIIGWHRKSLEPAIGDPKAMQAVLDYANGRNDPNRYNYLLGFGISEETQRKAGITRMNSTVARRCDYEEYTNLINQRRRCVLFPVRSVEGELRNIIARYDSATPNERRQFIDTDNFYRTWSDKYKKQLMEKSRNMPGSIHDVLYLQWEQRDLLKTAHTVVIVEGPKDALRIMDCGLEGVVAFALIGTQMSDARVEMLKKYVSHCKILLAMDDDAAGYMGNLRAYGKLWEAGFRNIAIIPLYKWGVNDFGELKCDTHKETVAATEKMLGLSFCPLYYYVGMFMRGRWKEFSEEIKAQIKNEFDQLPEECKRSNELIHAK